MTTSEIDVFVDTTPRQTLWQRIKCKLFGCSWDTGKTITLPKTPNKSFEIKNIGVGNISIVEGARAIVSINPKQSVKIKTECDSCGAFGSFVNGSCSKCGHNSGKWVVCEHH